MPVVAETIRTEELTADQREVLDRDSNGRIMRLRLTFTGLAAVTWVFTRDVNGRVLDTDVESIVQV